MSAWLEFLGPPLVLLLVLLAVAIRDRNWRHRYRSRRYRIVLCPACGYAVPHYDREDGTNDADAYVANLTARGQGLHHPVCPWGYG